MPVSHCLSFLCTAHGMRSITILSYAALVQVEALSEGEFSPGLFADKTECAPDISRVKTRLAGLNRRIHCPPHAACAHPRPCAHGCMASSWLWVQGVFVARWQGRCAGPGPGGPARALSLLPFIVCAWRPSVRLLAPNLPACYRPCTVISSCEWQAPGLTTLRPSFQDPPCPGAWPWPPSSPRSCSCPPLSDSKLRSTSGCCTSGVAAA